MSWAGGHGRQGQQQPSLATSRQRQQPRGASRQSQQNQHTSQRPGNQQTSSHSRLNNTSNNNSTNQSNGTTSHGITSQPGEQSQDPTKAVVARPEAAPSRPEWLNEYDLMGKIGEGTYGLVYLAKNKDKSKGSGRTAIKKFKQAKEGEGVSPTAIREIMLLRECCHENIVKLVNVHINHVDMSLYLAFDYAEHDFYEIIRYHRDVMKNTPMKEYTIKSFLWQLLNGLNYLHSNWIIHRDLKPSNILVMGEGEEVGVVKIADFGLARIYQAPLQPLSKNGVVVTIWYRAPELLLGSAHYTCAVDMWAVGCIFAEMLALKPLFQGIEDKSSQHAFQLDQLEKIFRVMGHPTVEQWPMLPYMPDWQNNRSLIQDKKYNHPTLRQVLPSSLSPQGLSLLQSMLEYDPKKRITAAQALEHEYFKIEPLPGRNAFSSGASGPGEKPIAYPARPVDRSTDLEKSGQPPQPLPPTQHQQQQGQRQQHQQQGGAGGVGLQRGGSHHEQHEQHGGAAGKPPAHGHQQAPTLGQSGRSGSSQGRTTRERSNLGGNVPPQKKGRLQ